MSGAGINGVRESLRAQQQLLNIEAGNLIRSQVPGAQSVRGTLLANDVTQLGNGRAIPGTGTSLSATTVDFSQGSVQRTGFTTDLAINGRGFFTLFDAKGEYYYTRRGDFHFDNSGTLVNSQGLFVGSFDPQTGEIEKTTIKVNPVTDTLGQRVLDQLEQDGALRVSDVATALGETNADISNSLAGLKVAGYVTEFQQGGETYFKSNLGSLGDQVSFDRTGILINETRGFKEGNQIALAMFTNEQGLVPGRFGGEVYQSTDAAVTGGIPAFGAPGDVKLGFGSIESQALEQSTSSATPSTVNMGFLQRNFTSTTKAMQAFLSAWDDLMNTIR